MKDCAECKVKESKVKELGGCWWWSVETMKPKFGREALTQTHLIRLGKELRTTGRCLTLYDAETACGLKFQTEVDSSD